MTFEQQLAADAGQPTTEKATNFIDELKEAFEDLANRRNAALDSTNAVAFAKSELDIVESEAVANGIVGKNAEERAAKLAILVAPQAENYRNEKRNQAIQELNLQHAVDRVRNLQMVLDAFKVGIALMPAPDPGTTSVEDLPFGLT